ncbi:YppE family protein [Cytobacillus massiliigabonensis]|uniref:YppE family protein n=1 Tax=Cytobacillus massiliigabonensis TaxID=1871011 RepID=UPI000C81F71E|nr:YppE family protein [Cytobacillus massiliigabonensis]
MKDYYELLQLTKKLLSYADTLLMKYLEVRETGKSGDFFGEVKPFADEVKEVNDAWKKEAYEWIKDVRPKNIYNQQIDSAYEHIETISVQAFFPNTSRSRFNDVIASAKFILTTIIHGIEGESLK